MNRNSVALKSPNILDSVFLSLQNNEPEKALDHLWGLILEDPSNSDAWLWLSRIALSNEQRLAFLRHAFETAPESPEIQRKLIEFVVQELAPLIQTEDREEAIRLIVEILDFFPKCEPAWFCLAFTSETEAECRHFLENLLFHNPNNRQAIAWLSSLGFPDNFESSNPDSFDPDSGGFIGISVEERRNGSDATRSEGDRLANVNESLVQVMEIEGTIGAAIADWKGGRCLGTIGGSPTFNLEIAAAGNIEVVRAKMRATANLGISESIEDILITLDHQFHLIRIIRNSPNLFFYVAIKKDTGNLAMARHKLTLIEKGLKV